MTHDREFREVKTSGAAPTERPGFAIFVVPAPRTIARRLAGLAVSLQLHVAFLTVVVLNASLPPPVRQLPAREITITDLREELEPDSTPGDRALVEERDMEELGGSAKARTDPFAFDFVKIRQRRDALFPFLTTGLEFVTEIRRDVEEAESKLKNPVRSSKYRTGTPPLAMSDAALQALVDRAWSRRGRWRSFSEIARLMAAHDPDEGQLPAVLRAYLDQNILQPFCDGATRDARFWAMLENASDHAEFIDFVRSFARRHPSSKVTTELMFLLDELVQGSRDALLMLFGTAVERDLPETSRSSAEAHALAGAIQHQYAAWLRQRALDTEQDIRRRYDNLRLRLLTTIVATTPSGYRASDARFLIGEIHFNHNQLSEALQWWSAILIDDTDSYVADYRAVIRELHAPPVNLKNIRRTLEGVYGKWRVFSIDRLRQFGHNCSTY